MPFFGVPLPALYLGLERVGEVVHILKRPEQVAKLLTKLQRLVARRVACCDQYSTDVNEFLINHNNPAFSSASSTAAVPISSAVSLSIFSAMSSSVDHKSA